MWFSGPIEFQKRLQQNSFVIPTKAGMTKHNRINALKQDDIRWNQYRSPELVEGRFSDVVPDCETPFDKLRATVLSKVIRL
jgi:hypothetical protein